jgi:hypothetical protein
MKKLSLLFLFPFLAFAADSKTQKLEAFYKKCLKNSVTEGKNQEKVCDCLKTNYQNRFDEKALDVLAKAHEGNLEKENLEEKEDILEFDLLASEKCVEDFQWRWAPPQAEKAKTPVGKSKKQEKKKP